MVACIRFFCVLAVHALRRNSFASAATDATTPGVICPIPHTGVDPNSGEVIRDAREIQKVEFSLVIRPDGVVLLLSRAARPADPATYNKDIYRKLSRTLVSTGLGPQLRRPIDADAFS